MRAQHHLHLITFQNGVLPRLIFCVACLHSLLLPFIFPSYPHMCQF